MTIIAYPSVTDGYAWTKQWEESTIDGLAGDLDFSIPEKGLDRRPPDVGDQAALYYSCCANVAGLDEFIFQCCARGVSLVDDVEFHLLLTRQIGDDGSHAQRYPEVVAKGDGHRPIMIVTSVVAIGVSSNFIVDLADFAVFLLYIVVPWSAINLVDYYYFVRRAHYSVDDILSIDGRYGLFNTRAVVIFLVGIAVEIPFMNASWPKFEGPVASSFGGADISWLVGFVVAGVADHFANRANGPVPETAAVPRGFSEAPVPVGAVHLATDVAPG